MITIFFREIEWYRGVLDFGGNGKALTFKQAPDGKVALRISAIARMGATPEDEENYTGQAFVMASGCIDLSDDLLKASREIPYKYDFTIFRILFTLSYL